MSFSSSLSERSSMLERQRQVALRRRQNQVNAGSVMRSSMAPIQDVHTLHSFVGASGIGNFGGIAGGGSVISQVQIDSSCMSSQNPPQRTQAMTQFHQYNAPNVNGRNDNGQGCVYQQSSTTVYGYSGDAACSRMTNSNVMQPAQPLLQPMMPVTANGMLPHQSQFLQPLQNVQPMMMYNDETSQQSNLQSGQMQSFPVESQSSYQPTAWNTDRRDPYQRSSFGNGNGMGPKFPSTMEDATIVSELTENRFDSTDESLRVRSNEPPRSVSVSSRDRNDGEITSDSAANATGGRSSRITRSISTRSLSFEESNKTDSSEKENESNGGVRKSDADPYEPSKTTEAGGSTKDKDHAAATNDASSKKKEIPSLSHVTSLEDINLDDPHIMRAFLMNPCPKGIGRIQCYIKRNKGIKNALFPEYRVYLKSNNTFLMTSKKRAGSKTSNYLIGMSRNDHDKNSNSILGKLRSNFLGTEYTIYDDGKNPQFDDSYYDEKNNDADFRCELGAILYAANTSLGDKGPRKMKVCIGKVDPEGKPLHVWQPVDRNDERMISCFKNREDSVNADKLLCLSNKPPSWNDEVKAYVLNFNGRVTMASVKNFQLVEESDREGNDVILQFGRVSKDEFSLDVGWPMSPFQGFALALSSFDLKLGCD